MKVYNGVIKKILTEDQYNLISKDIVRPEDISLKDTIREKEAENDEIIKYLPIRLSYKEVDSKGNDKFIFNEDKDEYQKSYKISPLMYAYAKELRIILELGEFSPVKVVIEEIETADNNTINKIICVQNQLCGKLA